jgi:paraquat-inducible protein B
MSAEPQIPRAVEKHGWWPGWIWSIPIAAVAIVVWLGLRTLTNRGPEVTVIFPVIADLKPANTQVKFEEVVVGRVESVRLGKDLQHMRVGLRLDPDMADHLGKGTKFWIAGRGFGLENLDSIRAIISGPYIALQPAPGHPQNKYIGLAQAPVLHFGERGTPFILHTDALNGIQHGTKIYYQGLRVGEVRGYRMIGPRSFEITAMIKAPFDKLVYTGTRFWNAGAIHFSTGNDGPKLQFRSIPALVDGAIAFETPFGPAQGKPGTRYTRFPLYNDQQDAEDAPDSQAVYYRVVFHGVSESLGRYAPVELMGSRVGSVTEAALEYSPASGEMSIDAIVALDPSRIQPADGKSWSDPRSQMDSMIQQLVRQGLRAEISSAPPLIGGHIVVLRIVPGAHEEMNIAGNLPEIPSASGSGVGDILQTASDVANKVDRLPLTAIADNVHESTRRIAAIVNSPAIPRMIRHAGDSVANVDALTADARAQLPQTIRSARKSVEEAQATLTSAQALLSNNPLAASQPETAEVPQALYEVSRAARSLRELSDFLDRHPDALIIGRNAHQ